MLKHVPIHEQTQSQQNAPCVCVCFNAVQMFLRHMETGDDSIILRLDTDGKGLEPIPVSPPGPQIILSL